MVVYMYQLPSRSLTVKNSKLSRIANFICILTDSTKKKLRIQRTIQHLDTKESHQLAHGMEELSLKDMGSFHLSHISSQLQQRNQFR